MCISKSRSAIYNFFHESEKCQAFFFSDQNIEKYSAYYTSMYLIQDTHESIYMHRSKGFSEDSLIAYIEFWGVMQAIIIQQDSISELYNAIIGSTLDTKIHENWQKIRLLRNACAGHPARKDRPKKLPLTRTFMGRTFGNYDEFTYEKWESPNEITHPRVNLSALIDSYETEAAEILDLILSKMKEQWPKS